MTARTLAVPGGTWTLAANTVDVVTLPATGVAFVQLSNHGTDWIYFTIDGAAPTVKGTALALGPGSTETFDMQGAHSVQLISATSQDYSVGV